MTKAEALKHAKRGVRLLRKNAISFAKKHGSRRYHAHGMSTASIMKALEIEATGWDQRAKVKGALTRALKEAVDLGLIERVPYVSEARWRYVGPEIKGAIQDYNKRVAEERRKVAQDLRALGLPIKAAGGAHSPNDTIVFLVTDIRRAANRRRGETF